MIALSSGRNLALQSRLETFLESPLCPPNSMNFYQLDGYLRAIACAPVDMETSQWQPLIFNDEQPTYETLEQRVQITHTIMELYQFHCVQVETDACDLPCSCAYTVQQDDRIDLEQWARGFLQGYIVCESDWNVLLDSASIDQIDGNIATITILDDLDDILSIVSAVADAKYAVELGTAPEELGTIFARLPESVVQCGQIGRAVVNNKLASTLASNTQVSAKASVNTVPLDGSSEKVNRNDPCPCGSGKKFKKCCLH